MNKEKTEAKLKTLTLEELNTLVDLLEAELITRYREDHKKIVENTMNKTTINRRVNRPASDRKRRVDTQRSAPSIGDRDGDVLWKHHGVTEGEAYDRYNEENG